MPGLGTYDLSQERTVMLRRFAIAGAIAAFSY
jgi:hypothetical protein